MQQLSVTSDGGDIGSPNDSLEHVEGWALGSVCMHLQEGGCEERPVVHVHHSVREVGCIIASIAVVAFLTIAFTDDCVTYTVIRALSIN